MSSKGWNSLSVTQLKTLRWMCEGDIGYEAGWQPAKRTGNALVKRGYLQVTEGIYSLTANGKRTVEWYVGKTGNGPERLKAMFRF